MNNLERTQEDISHYLLGQCTEEEGLRLQGQYLSDDGFLDLVMQVEEELIDAFLEGRLNNPQRDQFEEYYMVTNERREKVEFARSLRQRLQQRATTPVSSRSQPRRTFFGPVALDRRWLAAAASVIGLLLITCSWLVIKTLQYQDDLAASTTRLADQEQVQGKLQQQIAEERARNEQLASQVEELRNREEQVPADGASTSTPAIAMLVLAPGTTRDPGEEKTLVLEPTVKSARLRLFFRDADYKSYKATLRNAAGERLWSLMGIKAVVRTAAKSVDVIIPAPILKSDNYMLTLSGVANKGEQEISDYQFRVVRR